MLDFVFPYFYQKLSSSGFSSHPGCIGSVLHHTIIHVWSDESEKGKGTIKNCWCQSQSVNGSLCGVGVLKIIIKQQAAWFQQVPKRFLFLVQAP